VIDLILSHPQLGRLVAHPSVSYGATPLYMRGVLEEDTRPNLSKRAAELLAAAGADVSEGGQAVQLTVNDKKLSAPLRVRLRLSGGGAGGGGGEQ
jgi:ubiquitin-activating enzyme E1 C